MTASAVCRVSSCVDPDFVCCNERILRNSISAEDCRGRWTHDGVDQGRGCLNLEISPSRETPKRDPRQTFLGSNNDSHLFDSVGLAEAGDTQSKCSTPASSKVFLKFSVLHSLIFDRKASPVLFAVTMGKIFVSCVLVEINEHPGTGSISNLFGVFPYGYRSTPMLVLCLIFFFLNIFIFCLFTVLLTAKYSVYPRRLFAMLNHPVTSLYLGCFPMGATTIINAAVQVVNLHYSFGGKPLLYILWAMWWINVVLSLLFASVGVHVM